MIRRASILGALALALTACDQGIAPLQAEPDTGAPKPYLWDCKTTDLDSVWISECTKDDTTRIEIAYSQGYGDEHPGWWKGNTGGGFRFYIVHGDTIRRESW